MSLEIDLLVSFETKVMWLLRNRTCYRNDKNCFLYKNSVRKSVIVILIIMMKYFVLNNAHQWKTLLLHYLCHLSVN